MVDIGWASTPQAVTTLFSEAIDGGCPALQQWRVMVASDLGEQLDLCVASSNQSSCSDVPVLISPTKARRMTSILKAQAGVGVGSSDNLNGHKVVIVHGDRATSQREAEQSQMASYLCSGTGLMGSSLQVGMSVDCISVSGREHLSLAAYAKEASDGKEAAMWLPSQERLVVFVYLLICLLNGSYLGI